MNIAVIGSGYGGLVTGVCLADFGVHVTCNDKDVGRMRPSRVGPTPARSGPDGDRHGKPRPRPAR